VVTGVTAGSAIITATASGFTATSTITVTDNPSPCANPVAISIPFAKDGAGEFCFVSSKGMSYINSWNMDLVEINGVDFTNKWSNSLPTAIGGKWYIHYKGSFAWSHFEAPQAKSAEESEATGLSSDVNLYPNPVSNVLTLELNNDLAEGALIELFDNTGRLLESKKVKGSVQTLDMTSFKSGLYLIKVSNSSESIVKHIVKQ